MLNNKKFPPFVTVEVIVLFIWPIVYLNSIRSWWRLNVQFQYEQGYLRPSLVLINAADKVLLTYDEDSAHGERDKAWAGVKTMLLRNKRWTGPQISDLRISLGDGRWCTNLSISIPINFSSSPSISQPLSYYIRSPTRLHRTHKKWLINWWVRPPFLRLTHKHPLTTLRLIGLRC